MQNICFGKTDKILILSPHPDDESIGCGGLISRYASQIDVILLTDGCFGGEESPEQVKKIRAKEFDDAMQYANVHHWEKLSIHDRSLGDSFSQFKIIDFSSYTHIIIPHRKENQRDHKWVFPFLMRCKIKKDVLVMEYEVWTPMQNPNAFLPMQNYDAKRQLISFYRSQLKYNDYVSCAEGLNRYRGLTRGKYAECYDMHTFGELKAKYSFWHKLWGRVRKINGQTAYYFLGAHINITPKKS